jgi:hypothetical protein
MRHLLYIIVSAIVAFLLSLFFDGSTGKLVFVLLGSLFFCTLHLGSLIVEGVELLGRNDRKIFEELKEIKK